MNLVLFTVKQIKQIKQIKKSIFMNVAHIWNFVIFKQEGLGLCLYNG